MIRKVLIITNFIFLMAILAIVGVVVFCKNFDDLEKTGDESVFQTMCEGCALDFERTDMSSNSGYKIGFTGISQEIDAESKHQFILRKGEADDSKNNNFLYYYNFKEDKYYYFLFDSEEQGNSNCAYMKANFDETFDKVCSDMINGNL